MDDRRALDEKKETLLALLGRYERVAVAFSAGVDSTFLLKAAHDALGDRVLAVTGRTVSSPKRELREAQAFCEAENIRHIVIDVDQMTIPGFRDNPPDRCYICKKALFSAFMEVTHSAGFPVLAEGTNADDTHDYRPGLRALDELDVRSPLRDAGLGKQDIRALSREMGLPTWAKPSFACLATRIPYGEAITPQKLTIIDEAEQFLQNNGFMQARVRMHGKIARVEIEPERFPHITEPQLRMQILRHFTELGFDYVTLDLNGYETGSMNKTINRTS